MLFKPRSIFDIINEADDDENASTDAGGDTGADTGDAGETSDNNDSVDSGDDSSGDEDLDVDADLDADTGDSGGGDDMDAGGDDSSTDDTGGSDDTGFDSGGDDDSGGEPVKANTDIFSSLSAEEQKLKIGELKKSYASLYASIDDISERINNLDDDKIDIEVINRIISAVYKFKTIIGEYINSIYNSKSYIENKVQYMKFIVIINTIASVVEKVSKYKEKSS